MSNITQTARSKPITATTWKVYHLPMATANTEYSQALSNGTKKFTVIFITNADAKFSMNAGGTNTDDWSPIPACNSLSEENLDLTGATIYLQSAVAGQVAKITEWT